MYVKPCPFCGNASAPRLCTSKELDGPEYSTEYWAVCCSVWKWDGGCGATSGFMPNREETVAKWNQRATE